MKNKYLIPIFLLSILVSPAGSAGGSPALCPTITEIQSGGLSFVDHRCSDNTYTAGQISHYITPENWAFLIETIEASGEQEAMQKAKAALTGLSGSPKPVFDPSYGWVCKYQLADPKLISLAVVIEN